MPTYLLHGFRWPRPLVRIHIIMQNIDDAAPEWLVAPDTTLALLKNFHELYPECMQHLGRLRFVEQYDPNDSSTVSGISQPFAYVADLVEEVKLGVEIEDVRGKGLNSEQWSAMMELRDKIAPEEKVGWYIVVCGDEERAAPPSSDGGRQSAVSSLVVANRQSDVSPSLVNTDASATNLAQKSGPEPAQPEAKSQGILKKFLSIRLGRKKSRGDLNESKRSRSKSAHSAHREPIDNEVPPPLPSGPIPTYSDRSSSTPSIPPSAAASTPPPTDEIFELPAITPSSSRSTPPPSEFNFVPESEAQTKYIPTQEMPIPEVEPKCANMPPLDPQMRVAARRRSDVPSLGHRSAVDLRHSSRRHSDLLPSLQGRSSRMSDVSAMPSRSESPEFRQSRRVMSFPNVRSGAVSPLTFRSISPSGRSGAVSPIARNHSPVRSGAVSPLTHDDRFFPRIQRRSTIELRQQRKQQLALLNTQSLEPSHQRSSSQETDDDEEMDEVIMMSPAIRAPPKHFLRRSGTASSFMSLSNRSAPAMALDSIVEGDGRPYFGQEVDPNDLVAVNLENAFDNL